MNTRIVGLTWDQIQNAQAGRPYRDPIDTSKAGDYGADPIGDGTFRMIPSGDVVDYEERCARLGRKG
jgi:hypothetical protein